MCFAALFPFAAFRRDFTTVYKPNFCSLKSLTPLVFPLFMRARALLCISAADEETTQNFRFSFVLLLYCAEHAAHTPQQGGESKAGSLFLPFQHSISGDRLEKRTWTGSRQRQQPGGKLLPTYLSICSRYPAQTVLPADFFCRGGERGAVEGRSKQQQLDVNLINCALTQLNTPISLNSKNFSTHSQLKTHPNTAYPHPTQRI